MSDFEFKYFSLLRFFIHFNAKHYSFIHSEAFLHFIGSFYKIVRWPKYIKNTGIFTTIYFKQYSNLLKKNEIDTVLHKWGSNQSHTSFNNYMMMSWHMCKTRCTEWHARLSSTSPDPCPEPARRTAPAPHQHLNFTQRPRASRGVVSVSVVTVAAAAAARTADSAPRWPLVSPLALFSLISSMPINQWEHVS